MTRPKLLDLFCCAGGAAKGYHDAGFDVTGVDIRPQPNYPFRFVQGDALTYLAEHGRDYDAIHASPPCQAYSALNNLIKKDYPDLLAATREALIATGKPWVIENVVGAPFGHYVQLCGAMFGLRAYRHRRFETSFLVFQPHHPKHTLPVLTKRSAKTGLSRKESFLAGDSFASVTGNIGSYCGPAAMGIDWMTGDELSQAIPPAYTRWIGRYLLAAVEARKEAA